RRRQSQLAAPLIISVREIATQPVQPRGVKTLPGDLIHHYPDFVLGEEHRPLMDAASLSLKALVLAAAHRPAGCMLEASEFRPRPVEILEAAAVKHLILAVDLDSVVALRPGEVPMPFLRAVVGAAARIADGAQASPPHVDGKHGDLRKGLVDVAAAKNTEGRGLAAAKDVSGRLAIRGRGPALPAQRYVQRGRAEKPGALLVPRTRLIQSLAPRQHAERLEQRPEIGKRAGAQHERE